MCEHNRRKTVNDFYFCGGSYYELQQDDKLVRHKPVAHGNTTRMETSVQKPKLVLDGEEGRKHESPFWSPMLTRDLQLHDPESSRGHQARARGQTGRRCPLRGRNQVRHRQEGGHPRRCHGPHSRHVVLRSVPGYQEAGHVRGRPVLGSKCPGVWPSSSSEATRCFEAANQIFHSTATTRG